MAINPKLLNEGERVVVSTRTHVKVLIGRFLLLLVIVFLTAFVGSLVNNKISDDTTATTVGIVVGIVAAVAIVWWVVKPFVAWFTTSYTFTDRFKIGAGVRFSRNEQSFVQDASGRVWQSLNLPATRCGG